jgi:hypothetical protein
VRPIDYGERPPRYLLTDVMRAGESYCVPKPEPEPPPIAGEADTEREHRIDALRVTAEFKTKSMRPLDAGRKPITEAPLFGGTAQGELF